MAESSSAQTPSDSAEVWKSKGNAMYKAKSYDAAIEAYGKAIELDGSNPALKMNRAAAYLMLLMYKEANSDCDAALALDDTNSKAYFRKATALKGMGKLNEAISALETGLQHDPRSTTALADKEGLIRAKSRIPELQQLLSERKYSAALAQVDTVIKDVGTGFRELNLIKVEALIELSRPEDAYNLSNAMMRAAQHGDVELLHLRARCFYALGDLENAVKHLQQALRSDPDNSSVRQFYRKIKDIEEKKTLGDVSFKAGNFAEAIEKWSDCIDQTKGNKPFSAKLHLNRATALSKLKDFEKAVKDCNMAIYYNDKYIKAFLRRSECYLAMGGPEKIERGISDLETAFELENDEDALRDIKQKVKKAKVMLKRSKRKDLYATLGVSQTATESEIKTAYRKAALKCHPDKQANKSEEEKAQAEVLFKSIGEAYEILSNPEKKKRYDEGVEVEDIDDPHAGAGGGGGRGGGFGGMDPNIIFQMFMQQQQGRGGFH